jgi:hypothetical protein
MTCNPPLRSSMRVVNEAGIVSPLIIFERISDWGTSSMSRRFSKGKVSGPREACPFWNTCSRLPKRMRTTLCWRFEMNFAMPS